MNGHINRERLIGYIYQALPDPEWERVERHLPTCLECQACLAEQVALQKQIHAGVLVLQREVMPPPGLTFAAVSPRLQRSRRMTRLVSQSRQFVYSAVMLVVLVAFGIGLYALFSNINTPTVKPTPGLATVDPARPPEFVWKISGDPNPLSHPSGMGIDREGNLYVVDTGNQRIQKFDSNGQFLMMWGSPGSGEGQFNFVPPKFNTVGSGDIVVDSQGNIYVADSGNARIQKFDREGHFLTQWGRRGADDGQFESPFGLAVDGQDHIYVVDANAHIQKFDSKGQFLTKWGDIGVNEGEFTFIGFPAVDRQGYIYLADGGRGRIQKFDQNGRFLSKWDNHGQHDDELIGANGLAVDGQGYIYVTHWINPRIQKLDSTGKFLLNWGSQGQGDGQLSIPADIAVDRQGNVYVSDYDSSTIQKFRQ
jgi:streptogramin lyase